MSSVVWSAVVDVVACVLVLEVVRLRVESMMSCSIRCCTKRSLLVVALVVVHLACDRCVEVVLQSHTLQPTAYIWTALLTQRHDHLLE